MLRTAGGRLRAERIAGLFVIAVGVALPTAVSAPAGAETRNVAIVVHEGVELLDFAGPGEVFEAVEAGAFQVFTVGETTEPVTSQGFLKITPNYSIENCPQPGILVIP